MKPCAKCGTEHPGKHSYCKPCLSSYQREWREKNPGAQRAYKKKWEAEHPEEVREAKRRRYHSDLDKAHEYRVKQREEKPEMVAAWTAKRKAKVKELGGSAYYRQGITMEQRTEFHEKQKGICPLCDRPLDGLRVHVDHDHAAGLLRGLLCERCNRTLGWYETRAEAVDRYLAGPHVVPGAPIARMHNRRTRF